MASETNSPKPTRSRKRLYEKPPTEAEAENVTETAPAVHSQRTSGESKPAMPKATSRAKTATTSAKKAPATRKARQPTKKKGLNEDQLKFIEMLDNIESKNNASASLRAQRNQDANETIFNHAMTASGFGLIPIPIVDLFATANIQYALITRLAQIYGHDVKKQQIKSLVTALLGSVASYAVGKRIASSIFKGLPWGAWTLSLPMAATDGMVTYAIGKVFKNHFSTGGTVVNFDLESAKKKLPGLMKEGGKLLNKKKPIAAS